MKTTLTKCHSAAVLLLLVALTANPNSHLSAQETAVKAEQQVDLQMLELLDADGDGTLDPYEALDVLLALEAEKGQRLTKENLSQMLAERAADDRKMISGELAKMDTNNDGKTTVDELDEGMQHLADKFDPNGDGVVSVEEAMAVDISDGMLMTKEDIDEEAGYVMSEFDTNKDGQLTKSETNDDEIWSQLVESDADGDGKVTAAEFKRKLKNENYPAAFEIKGDTAVMTGVISSCTPGKVLRLVFEHPSVRTIEMAYVPGSIDDTANLRAASYVRKFGFTTVLKSDHSVASGGTDFFLAGKHRTIEKGAKFGVHSWGGLGHQGKDVPKDSPEHQLYLKYYEKMGTPAEFYWFTLEAASAHDIHWMTDEELDKYNFRSGK